MQPGDYQAAQRCHGGRAHQTDDLGWFDITLLEKVERTFRELGLTKNTLEVQRLFTNEVVQAL